MSNNNEQQAGARFVCTGDEMRCHDGNGCECAMRGLKPAAAQEAVARVPNGHLRRIVDWLAPIPPAGTPLYAAAPVAAAPAVEAVELTVCCGREECGGECGNEWRGTEWVRKAASTPAAPGIDVGKLELWFFRELSSYQRQALFRIFGLPVDEIGESHINQKCMLRHVLGIDASPKGGSDVVPDDLPGFLRWCAGELVKRDKLAGDGIAECLLGRAAIIEYASREQATSAEVGA